MGAPLLIPAIGAAAGALMKPNNPLQGALLGAAAGYTGGQALGLTGATAASGGGLTMGAKGVTGLTSGTGAALNAGANTANAGLYSLGSGTTAGLSAVPASTTLIDPITMGQREAFFSQAANINQPLVKPFASGFQNAGNVMRGGLVNTPQATQVALQSPIPKFAGIEGTNINTMASDAAQSIIPTQAANAPLNYSLVAPSAVTSAPSTSLLDKAGMYATSAYENPVATGQTFGYVNSLLQPDQQMASAPTVPIAKGQLRDFNPMASMDPYRQSVISNQPISLLG